MFFSEFDTLLMYINLQTRSHIFLKISIFCKKIITFSSSAHLMKKSTFFPKFQFFFCTKLTLLHQNWYDRNTCHFASKFAWHYFINELRNSLICQKNWHFLHKMLFFTKRKQCHQKLTLFKNRRYFFKNT